MQLATDATLPNMLSIVRRETSDLVSAFEFITPTSFELVGRLGHGSSALRPGAGGALIVELSASSPRVPLEETLLATLEILMDRGWAEDALIAQSDPQRQDIWTVRESIPEGEKRAGGSVKHDISVPISAVSEYLARGAEIVADYDPSLRLSIYGHVGDGNIHYNILVPDGSERLAFSVMIEADLSLRLYDLAGRFNGTFSAEHGVGRLKRSLLERYSDQVRFELMRRIKRAFDPQALLNSNAVVAPSRT
jgi:FAD/FMN-containing dehydrogenase